MSFIISIYTYFILEPFTWLCYWGFQHRKLALVLEPYQHLKRFIIAGRLFLLLFLINYSCNVLILLLLHVFYAQHFSALHEFVFPLVGTTLLGTFVGALGGFFLGSANGIGMSLVGGIVAGLLLNRMQGTPLDDSIGGFTAGLIASTIIRILAIRAGRNFLFGLSIGLAIGLLLGLAIGRQFGGAIGTIAGNSLGMGIGIVISRKSSTEIGSIVNQRRSFIVCVILSILLCFIYTPMAALFFTFGYCLVIYRLPLYGISCLSSLMAYRQSKKQASRSFFYLHTSSLYWDEQGIFPLPGIRSILTIAAQQDVAETLKEINFIVYERPQQMNAARITALEIVLRDFYRRDSLRAMAQASQRFAEIFPQGTGLMNPLWLKTFVHLNNASFNANRACSPSGWPAKSNALQEIVLELRAISLNEVFTRVYLNDLLEEIVAGWLEVAQYEIQMLENAPEKTKFVSNPYSPGLALELNNPSFVGRLELAQVLSNALGRADYRPTFLLYGERRMGKSSILRHLPNLLSRRYITVFYDLQNRGISSSAVAFLTTVAEGICEGLRARSFQVKDLDISLMQQASQQNEAAIYYIFMRWFKQVNALLLQEDCILLLSFDEVESLEDAQQQHFLDLTLLFDWFRSLLQNYGRVSLLFSGLKVFGEIGADWTRYFVHVEILKVSFLTSDDARKLILQPNTQFPGARIFSEEVITEIIRVTHRHPFLIQATCSVLIDQLNSENLQRIELSSMDQVLDKVLKSWGSTYFRDIWERASSGCQTILRILTTSESVTFMALKEISHLDGDTLRHTLESLLECDLILLDENNSYRIVVPLFYEWVKRTHVVPFEDISNRFLADSSSRLSDSVFLY